MSETTQPKRGWSDVRRLLAVRPDGLGDVLMTTPALRAVRDSLPGVHVTLLTSTAGATAVPHVPEIDDALVLPMPWVKEFPADQGPDDVLAAVELLRGRRFDACVVFGTADQNPAPAALIAYLAGIPLRLSYSSTWLWHLLTDWVLDTETLRSPELRHETVRALDLVRSRGLHTDHDRLSFTVGAADRRGAVEVLRAAGVNHQLPYVVVHPGASSAKRRYDRYADVVAGLTSHTGLPVVVTGLADEVSVAAQVAAASSSAVSVAGQLSLGAFAAVVDGAAVAVTNNTATSHIAAAVSTPVVVLYARTNPQHLPWRVPHRALYYDYEPCEVCAHAYCADPPQVRRRVAPETVVAAALEQLGLGSPVVEGPALRF